MASVQSAANDVGTSPGARSSARGLRWQRVLLASAAVTGLVLAFALLATPQYRGEARLLIETAGPSFTGSTPGSGRSPAGDDRVADQIEVILSADLLAQVALRLDLARLPEFDATAEPSRLGRMLVAAGLSSDPGEVPPQERVLKAFRDKLSIRRVKGSRIVEIELSSEDPRLAADIPNALAEAYLAMQSTARELSDAATWLEPEIAGLSKEVEMADARVAGFRARSNPIIARSSTAGAALRMSEISAELSRVRQARAKSEGRAKNIGAVLRGDASLDELPETPSFAEFRKVRETQAKLGPDFAGLPEAPSGEHPGDAALRSRLAVLDRQIRTEAEIAMKDLISEAAGAEARESRLLGDLGRLRDEAVRAGELEIELRGLEREANAQRELLDSYLARYRQALSRKEGNFPPVDVRILQRAVAPSEPYFPKVLPIAAAAFAFSLLVMSLLEIVRELLRNRAMPPSRARPEPIDEVPVLQTVSLERAPRLPAPVDVPMPPSHPGGEQAECFGKTGIEGAAEKLVDRGAKRAIFVSPEGDAAAAAAVLVAREVADAGLRVLLLDLTASGAASLSMLHGVSLPGITDLLASKAQFTDVIHQDHHSDCHVIPVGTADPERAMRSADRLPIIMDSLTAAYDMVVVECGPTDAEGIRRLVTESTQVLVSLIEAEAEVSRTAERLRDTGHRTLMLVTPAGYRPAGARARDRSAA